MLSILTCVPQVDDYTVTTVSHEHLHFIAYTDLNTYFLFVFFYKRVIFIWFEKKITSLYRSGQLSNDNSNMANIIYLNSANQHNIGKLCTSERDRNDE